MSSAASAASPADDTVVVSSSSAPDPSATSASVTVIPVDERLPLSADVASAVDEAAGCTVRHLGGLGDFSAVSIRGSSLRQVQVFLDGVPLNPDGAAAVDLSELPLRAFRRVEVYRGNAPPELAASPIGGVVNLVSGDALPKSLSASAGSFGTWRMDAATTAPLDVAGVPGQALWFAETFSTRGDFRYFTDAGTTFNLLDDHVLRRQNDDKTQLAADGRIRLGDDRLRLTLLDAFLAREEGLPGHENERTVAARLSTQRNLASVDVDGGSDVARGKARLWSQVRSEALSDPKDEIGIARQETEDTTSAWGALLEGHVTVGHAVPTATIDLRRERYVSIDHLSGADPVRRTRQAATASLAAPFTVSTLTISPVVQATWLDSRDVADDQLHGTDKGETTTQPVSLLGSPRLGVLWRPLGADGPLALKANAGRYFRPPDLTELYGDRGAVRGNPELVPETGWQWDTGARLASTGDGDVRGAIEATYFWNDAFHLISWIQNAQQTLVPVNVGHGWVQGLELAATGEAGPVEAWTSLTRDVSVNLSSDPAYANKQLPRVPAWDVETREDVHVDVGRRVTARLGHTFSYSAGNYWDSANFLLAAPRPVHGAFGRATVHLRHGDVEAEADVLNLLDRFTEVVPRNPLDPTDPAEVVQPITDWVGYPLPGRTFLFTLRFVH